MSLYLAITEKYLINPYTNLSVLLLEHMISGLEHSIFGLGAGRPIFSYILRIRQIVHLALQQFQL